VVASVPALGFQMRTKFDESIHLVEFSGENRLAVALHEKFAAIIYDYKTFPPKVSGNCLAMICDFQR